MGPNFVLDKGFQATTAIGQFRAVILTANDQIKQVDTANTLAIGFCQEDVNAADVNKEIVNTRILGITRAIAGAAIARNARVAVNATGQVITATTGQLQVGIAIIAAAASGDQIDLLLTPGAIAP